MSNHAGFSGNTILRCKQVQNITGLSKSTIYAEIKAGRFPKQVRLTSKRCVGWLNSDIDNYIQNLIDQSRNANGGV